MGWGQGCIVPLRLDLQTQALDDNSDDDESSDEEALEASLGDILGDDVLAGSTGNDGGGRDADGQGVSALDLAGAPPHGHLAAQSDPLASEGSVAPAPQVPQPELQHRAPSVASSVQRDVADVVVPLAHGHISFYAKGSRFQATCTQVGHVRCRLTRTGNTSDRRAAQGRPVGLMCAWLGHLCAPTDHRNTFLVKSFGHDARREARHVARAMAGSSALEACERARRPDEADSEPEEAP